MCCGSAPLRMGAPPKNISNSEVSSARSACDAAAAAFVFEATSAKSALAYSKRTPASSSKRPTQS